MPAGLWFKSPQCWNLDFVFSGWTWVSRSPGSDQMGGRFPFWPFHTTIFIGADATTAHRLILASRCEFFRAMFTGNLSEGQLDVDGKVVCGVEDTTTPALKLVLRYLYTDVLEQPEDDESVQVVRLADRYGVERLVEHLLCSHPKLFAEVVQDIGPLSS